MWWTWASLRASDHPSRPRDQALGFLHGWLQEAQHVPLVHQLESDRTNRPRQGARQAPNTENMSEFMFKHRYAAVRGCAQAFVSVDLGKSHHLINTR